MIRRKLVWGLVGVVAVCALTFGCGDVISTTSTTPDTGGLVVLVTDTPACNVLNYSATVGGMILRSTSEGNAANAFKGVILPNIKVNFGGLKDTTSILRVAPVTVGTYDELDLTLGSVGIGYFDPTQTNLIRNLLLSSPSSAITYKIQPPLTISKGTIAGLKMDLDVRHSITVKQDGSLTGTTTPAITFATVTPNSVTGFGHLQDMRGFVLSVTSGSTISQFLGSINVQLHTGATAVPQIPVNIATTTTVYTPDYPMGIEGSDPDFKQVFSGILGGSFIEVDGYVNSQGNMVADTVQVEDQENAATRRAALIGTITAITRDLSGVATQLRLYVAEAHPDSVFNVTAGSSVLVNVTNTTKFDYASHALNFASLPFGASNLQMGQQVIVHGPSTPGATNNETTVDAESIYLKLQTHEGNFSSLVTAGSDDRTGAFWLKPCCTIFQGSPILVLTNSDTSFLNVVGLSGLTPQPSLVIKGLMFYEPNSVTVSGVSVPAGTLVILADQVHSVS